MTKKYYFATLAAAFVLLFAVAAQAAVTPTINGIKSKKKNSLTLKVQDTGLKKKKVFIQVYVDEVNEGEIYTFKYREKLNGSGKEDVKVKGLDQGTTYRFRVRMRENSVDEWSDWSDYYYTTTKGHPIW